MVQLLQNMGTEQQLLVVIIIAVVFFVVWLALRKTRLWYWKINQQATTAGAQAAALDGIEQQLKAIGEILAGAATAESSALTKDNAPESVDLAAIEDVPSEATSGAGHSEEEAAVRSKFTTMNQCQSKSGHLYTAEEIEAQIRE